MEKRALIISELCLISSIIWGNSNKLTLKNYQSNENSLNRADFSISSN